MFKKIYTIFKCVKPYIETPAKIIAIALLLVFLFVYLLFHNFSTVPDFIYSNF